MGGGTYINFRRGTTGGSGAHMNYISRESAVGDREGVITQNMPEEITNAQDYKELRTNLRSYAEAREDSEIAGHKYKGEPRTHFRTTISFENSIKSEQIKRMTQEWLKENFDKARAVGFVHRDTAHTHVHVWIDARQTNGKKIDLKPSKYKSLDEKWNQIYSREMGKEEKEHLSKKLETRKYKQGQVKEKPSRMNTVNKDTYLSRETSNYQYGAKKERFRRNQREITRNNQELERSTGYNSKREPGIERIPRQPNKGEQRITRNNSPEERKLSRNETSKSGVRDRETVTTRRVTNFRGIKSRLDRATKQDRDLTAQENELYSRIERVYKRVRTENIPNRGESRDKERTGNIIDRSFRR